MEEKKGDEGLEPSVHESEDASKDVVNEISGESTTVPAVDDLKSSIQEAVENLNTDGAEESLDTEPANDETKSPNQADQADQTDQAKVRTENGASKQAETPSKRVQEGQRWNDRNRERKDYKKNIKSDLTSQEESSDPVAIRKQVNSLCNCPSSSCTKCSIPDRILLL